ncbi:MAG: histidine phosphatase family protein [Synergistes sp.]|nr:histidine phosphatase family protein [Synergistes sp.]
MASNTTENSNAAPGLSASAGGRMIYFLRHGRTEWNNQLRYQGAVDIPLNEDGRMQAHKAALRFSSADIDAVISSPLSRAMETAERIASFHKGLKVESTPLLTEVDFGKWEGRTVPEIKAGYADVFAKWRNDPLNVDAPGGESMDSLYERCGLFAEQLLARPERSIVVVGHGAMLRALFPRLLQLPRVSYFWKTRLDNCSITAFSADAGRFALIYQNDTLHLKITEDKIAYLPIL